MNSVKRREAPNTRVRDTQQGCGKEITEAERDAKAAARKRWIGASAGDVSEAGHKGPRGLRVART